MIVGERFAWGHLPKTGGDAVHTLFHAVVPDLVVWADPVTARPPRSKHDPFTDRGLEVTSKPILALNMRRLPSRQLSRAHHIYRHGEPPHHKPMPMATPAEIAASSEPDRLLNRFTDGGRLKISVWLRMEQLREDFVRFVSQLRPLSPAEEALALSRPTKKQVTLYDHDVSRVFTRAQVEQLYALNPVWAAVERDVYGDLMLDHPVSWVGEDEDAGRGR